MDFQVPHTTTMSDIHYETEQYEEQSRYITREDPAFLLLLILAAHPELTLDYGRMSSLSRLLPDPAMWTTDEEIDASIHALVQLAGAVRRLENLTIDGFENNRIEQRWPTDAGFDALYRTDAEYDEDGANHFYSHTTVASEGPPFDHQQGTALANFGYNSDGADNEYDDDNDDDDRTSIASWISGRVWVLPESGHDYSQADGLFIEAGRPGWLAGIDHDEPVGPWLASNMERDRYCSPSPSMPCSDVVEYDSRSEPFIDPDEPIEWEASADSDQNGPETAFWPSLNMSLGEHQLQPPSVPCSDIVEYNARSERFIESEGLSGWAIPPMARNFNGPPTSFWAPSDEYQFSPLSIPFTDAVQNGEAPYLDDVSDSASVRSIGGGVWMGD